MSIKKSSWTALIAAAAVSITPVLSLADDETVRKDLTAVLALKGHPCGKIVELSKTADNDYLVTCADGNRYHIFIDAQDRVIVEVRK